MDFFESQDTARRNSGRLVVLFVVAVLGIIAMVYVVVALTMGQMQRGEGDIAWERLLNLKLLGAVGLGTIAVVAGGSLYKVSQLAAGGRVVAEQLGGRLLDPSTSDLIERKVLNVVEEMAIASGTPTPPVYLMENERGINAFAAGYSPSDAVIGVTRGSAEQLTRDQLQGVMAHEFSHILNGDMRLNIRLIGLVHGILIIGLIGYFVLRSAVYSGAVRRRSKKDNPMPLIALGAALVVIGFLGTLFGNLIKAAVSRQREFLADASAVQFTRNPDGLAGALKQIGGLSDGSNVKHPNAPEASHMFFGQAIASGFTSMFATHPPLAQRIKRIDPSWDGRMPDTDSAAPPIEEARGAPGLSGFASAAAASAAAAATAPQDVLATIGRPTEAHVQYAGQLIEALPEAIRQAVHEPHGAMAVIYTMLLHTEEGPRRVQMQALATLADPGVLAETRKLLAAGVQVPTRARLPLIDLAIPPLRSLSPRQYGTFRQTLDALVRADKRIDLFEWSLQRILLHHLERHFGVARPPRVQFRALRPLQGQCEVLLSALAHVGHDDADQVQRAFDRGLEPLKLPGARLRPAQACGLDVLDGALERLDRLSPGPKRQVLAACIACATADRRITVAEAELLRAVFDALDCPMPPLLPGQEMG